MFDLTKGKSNTPEHVEHGRRGVMMENLILGIPVDGAVSCTCPAKSDNLSILPEAAQLAITGDKPKRRRSNIEARAASKRAYSQRHKQGVEVLRITAKTQNAEAFARRFCGLRGKHLSTADIEQAITNFINDKGKI
jgi:hypothetical protein